MNENELQAIENALNSPKSVTADGVSVSNLTPDDIEKLIRIKRKLSGASGLSAVKATRIKGNSAL